MPAMTDPAEALASFQEALLAGEIRLQRGAVDPDLYVYADRPNGMPRLTYVRLEAQTVTVFVNFALADPVEGMPCFQIGYAVPPSLRRQGRAKNAVTAALAELQVGMRRNGVAGFYIEAVVGVDNPASQRVAEETIAPTATPITDEVSGQPALQYLREIPPG
jgi:hypothetical protein